MNEHISTLLAKPWAIPTAVGVAAFSGGLGIGYFLGKRKADKTGPYTHVYKEYFADEDDCSPVSDHPLSNVISTEHDPSAWTDYSQLAGRYDTLPEVEEAFTPTEVPVTLMPVEVPVTLTAVEDHILETVEVVEPPFNVFAVEHEDVWDHELELTQRTVNRPYVITVQEFKDDDMGYRQGTLTYYEGDDILTDHADTPIFQHQKIVGDLKFGHGSGDQNVVYIRNEKLQVEYEILRSRGSYETEVMGLQIEEDLGSNDLRHSATRFRFD